MTTDIMVTYLRNLAMYGNVITDNDRRKINECADKIEEMDKRISIMAADMDKEWGKSY